MLPACVAVFVHPEDERYRAVVGRHATTPLFDLSVPVLADEGVAHDKGTGAVMCCTFGDVADVGWWRSHGLPLRITLTEDGHMNELSGPYAGLTIKAARAKILEDLAAAGMILEQRTIKHAVGVHDRCGTPVEYVVASQWFVRLLDSKERFLEAGRRIAWHPEHMRARYESWIAGLNWDWNISRQRYYGVPFPVWYCVSCNETVLADRAQLPVDPQETGPTAGVCPHCGGTRFRPDTDVMDTWATSSVTPRICATLLEPLGVSSGEFTRRYRPMSLRPNAHDIIRTWDFYTIVRSLYATDDIPWTDVLISGHALDPAGKKMSKSKLTATQDPTAMVEQYSADAVRYWATSVRTGGDTTLSDEVMRNGNRFVTKLWNAAKLALPHLDGVDLQALPRSLTATDRWLLARVHTTVERATAAMEDDEIALAKGEVERFFWADFCDYYLEMVKLRLYNDAGDVSEAGREAACYTVASALLVVLKLLAPVMPHITDAIYQTGFRSMDDAPSIHVSRWPQAPRSWSDGEAERVGHIIQEIVDVVRRWKAERRLSVGTPLASLHIGCPPDVQGTVQGATLDLRSITRASRVTVFPVAEGGPLSVVIDGVG